MVYIEDYIFWVIPDLAEKPRTYLIYRLSDRTKVIAYVEYDNKRYDFLEIAGNDPISPFERSKIIKACDIFLQQIYFYNWE